MAAFKVLVEELSTIQDELPKCLLAQINEIRKLLESIRPEDAMKERSKSLKRCILSLNSKSRRIQFYKTSVFTDARMIGAGAIFEIDGENVCNQQCGEMHITNMVVCLNNRETIGTNFLKLEVASRESQSKLRNNKNSRNILGVLITFDESVLETGNWDKSYAKSLEYTTAYKNAYHSILKSQMMALQVCLA